MKHIWIVEYNSGGAGWLPCYPMQWFITRKEARRGLEERSDYNYSVTGFAPSYRVVKYKPVK